jgi:hypothetical protein
MAIESATYINGLDTTKPGSSDPKSEGDDHLRLLKSTIKATFPNVTGAVTATHTELSYVDGVTSAIQTQLDTKAPTASPTFTGTPSAPTAAATTNTTQLATTEMVQAAIMASSGVTAELPGQSGNAGKFLTTNGTAASWAKTGVVSYSGRTSNTALGVADLASLIDITSGTFTQTFAAAATLGDGWWCYIRNSGTGDVTLDPNASETIDGLTSYVMYPGEVRLVQCDGSALRTLVASPFFKTFTASGTFTKPPGYSVFSGLAWGSGGSGGKRSSNGSGGGGASCVPFSLASTVLGATETITIAAQTAGATVDNTAGVNGNNTTLGAFVTAYGGGAGQPSSNGGAGGGVLSAGSGTTPGGPLGAASGLDSTFGGGGSGNSAPGGKSVYGGAGGGGINTNVGQVGGESLFGGGGGGGAGSTSAGAGGVSRYGGAGGAGGVSASGVDGTAPGGGGGGTYTGTKAGDGARGELRIWGAA